MRYMITNKTEISENSKLLKPDFILFRDKNCDDYAQRALNFLKNSKAFGAKLFLHNDYNLALKLGADGVHFSTINIQNIAKAPKNLIKIASTHSEYELRAACDLGVNFITFSPIFASPNKGEPKGIKALEYIVKIAKNYGVGVFGLGGILENSQIEEILNAGACGFASIRYFEKMS